MMTKQSGKEWLVSVLTALGAGVLGTILAGGTMQQYGELYRPPLAPPGWLFPIVWTILYVLMGTAAYLVSRTDSEKKSEALKIYAVQLVVNLLWPMLFFRFEAYWFAFFWLLLLWILIVRTVFLFSKADKVAAYLMIPYLIWVTFAGYLNAAIALSQTAA